MKKRAGQGDQFVVEIRLGPDALMTSILSLEQSDRLMDTLDGSREDVDAMFVTLLGIVMASIYQLPTRWVLEPLAEVLLEAEERLKADMADADVGDLPF